MDSDVLAQSDDSPRRFLRLNSGWHEGRILRWLDPSHLATVAVERRYSTQE